MHRKQIETIAFLCLLSLVVSSSTVAETDAGKTIRFVETRRDHPDYFAVVTCQGLAHRKFNHPCVYVDNNSDDRKDKFWHPILEKKLSEYQWVDVSERQLIAWAKQQRIVKSQVLYDPSEEHALNNVGMLCSIYNALPVTKDAGLPTAFDCRRKWADNNQAVRWAVAELLTQCSREYAGIPKGGKQNYHDIRDFLVANRIFTFHPFHNGEVAHLLRHVLEGPHKHFSESVPVLGYLSGAEIVAANTESHSQPTVVSDTASNLSFHSLFEGEKGLKQPPINEIKYRPHNTYVSIISSDGDNVGFSMGAVPGDLAIERDFPMSWTISNHMQQLAPFALEWCYTRAQDSQKDSFLMGPSGYGYLEPNNMTDTAWFAEKTIRAAIDLDMSATVDWESGEQARVGEIQDYLKQYAGSPIRAVFCNSNSRLPCYVENIATLRFLTTWGDQKPPRPSSQIAETLSSDRLRGKLVYLRRRYDVPMSQIADMVSELSPHVKLVGYRELIAMAEQLERKESVVWQLYPRDIELDYYGNNKVLTAAQDRLFMVKNGHSVWELYPNLTVLDDSPERKRLISAGNRLLMLKETAGRFNQMFELRGNQFEALKSSAKTPPAFRHGNCAVVSEEQCHSARRYLDGCFTDA